LFLFLISRGEKNYAPRAQIIVAIAWTLTLANDKCVIRFPAIFISMRIFSKPRNADARAFFLRLLLRSLNVRSAMDAWLIRPLLARLAKDARPRASRRFDVRLLQCASHWLAQLRATADRESP
jgi:hypothetical protein